MSKRRVLEWKLFAGDVVVSHLEGSKSLYTHVGTWKEVEDVMEDVRQHIDIL